MECISLILGIIAWVVPFAAKEQERISSMIATGVSFGCCGIAVLLQFVVLRGFVLASDMGAIEDTIGMMMFASAVLVVVTITLNLYAMNRRAAIRK